MSNPDSYGKRNIRELLPKDVPAVPGSVDVVDPDKLTEMVTRLHGHLKEINNSRVFKIASDLKQLTWDEAESIGKGLYSVLQEEGYDKKDDLDGSVLTQIVQTWATKTIQGKADEHTQRSNGAGREGSV